MIGSTPELRAPDWRVSVDGVDVTDRLRPRLLDLTLTEHRGGEADELELRLEDHDGGLALPRRGALMRVQLGWQGQALVDKGSFTVDEITHSGAPDVITVKGRSADLTRAMQQRRDKSWHQTTVGALVRSIASAHGLQAHVHPTLSGKAVPHIDQASESDLHFLSRLGKRLDAVATVKQGRLLFAPIGAGTTATGAALPAFELHRRLGDQHSFTLADRDDSDEVSASWHDKRAAQRKTTKAGGGNRKHALRGTHATQQDADDAARAERQRRKRATAQLRYTLALGNAALAPEQRIRVRGFKPEIDGQAWLLKQVTHTVTGSSGFATEIEAERDA